MRIKFEGVVRGYAVGDDNLIHLAIDEQEVSYEARDYVNDMIRKFNPQDGTHGYGSRNKECTIKPGFSSYRVALPPEQVKDIAHGMIVEVSMEVFHVRKVRFYNNRWSGIPEMRYEIESVRPLRVADGGKPHEKAAPEKAGK